MRLEELTADTRTREVGRMLSGAKLTPEALKIAEIRMGRPRRDTLPTYAVSVACP